LTKIKLASIDGLSQILEIEQEAFSPPWTFESLLNEVGKEDSYFITAVDKLDLLGYAILRQVGDDGELLKIAVDKQTRCKGVGAFLMAAILEHAAEKAFESVFLEVRESNTAAVKLYEKYGFKVIRVRKDYYNDPVEDALIMNRECKNDKKCEETSFF